MHSVDLLEEALQVAMNSGFEVRQEWFNEQGGGACRIGEQKVLFVDLSLTAQEQLEHVVEALRRWPINVDETTSPELVALLMQQA